MESLINSKETYDDFEAKFHVISAIVIPKSLDERQKNRTYFSDEFLGIH